MSPGHRLPLLIVATVVLGCTAVEPLGAIPREHPASQEAVEASADTPPDIVAAISEPVAGESTAAPSSPSMHEHHGERGGGGKAQVYTCMMHPEVRTNAPGTCPKCGMTLVVATDGPEKR